MKSFLYKVLFTLAACVVLFALYIASVKFKNEGVIKIKSGDSVYSVLSQVENMNILTRALARVYLGNSVQKGNYSFKPGQRLALFLRSVKRGHSDVCTITFVPGKTFYYYKKQLMDDVNFDGDVTVSIPEGYILPDTYSFKCQYHRNKILKYAQLQMENFLKKKLSSVDWQNFYLKNVHEVLTMASIVEKETGVSSERSIVASVFKNRLKIRMRLQTDPTVIYQESDKTGELGRLLTTKDLQKKGKYNTYKMYGLPSGPIASPSKEAVEATLNPKDTNYLYFVASGGGGHNFAKNYKEHRKNVVRYKRSLGK